MPNKAFQAEIKLILSLLLLGLCGPVSIAQTQPTSKTLQEVEVDEPLPPQEAARTMVVPEGFKVTLFAGEPDVRQPIAFCIDDRGRLWVAEAYNYPHHGTEPGDRILIFEDSDQDGCFDKRTVFYDKLNYVTGIEVGFGGAWVMSPPNLYFIPDRNGDDQPDGEPLVLLDGFGNHANSHNLANGFSWGPDGWLYGTHGRTNWSLIGKPGTPQEDRVRFDGGVYRYHPATHQWEPYADGTTNPWGIDWNDVGEAFICNCVNPHLFHVIYGAHYEPWRNRESSQYAFERIDTIADHLHFVGANNVRDGLGSAAEDEAGGGHAHCGTMIYLGDNWPERYRNSLFTNNIHGRRINNDLLQRSGSGYVASHGKDLLRSKDPWFMGVTLRYGPDGSVFASDWSDTGECHSVKITRRETGRLYKISYGQPKAEPVDLAALSTSELIEKQLHHNDWHVQHARRLLQERAAAGQDMSKAAQQLLGMFKEQPEVPRKLRALWALHVLGQLRDAFLIEQLENESEYIRAWSVRLLCEDHQPPDEALKRFVTLAAQEQSPFVRLYLASCLQRLKPADRWNVAAELLRRVEDTDDDNIPLMIWYAIEPLVNEDPNRFVLLAKNAKLPLVARHIGRRIAGLSDAKESLAFSIKTLGELEGSMQNEFLSGIMLGLAGRRSVPMPATWPMTFIVLKERDDNQLLEKSLQLALIFDDAAALEILKNQALEENLPAAVRNQALQALINKKARHLDALLLELIGDPNPDVVRVVVRGLAEYDNPDIPTTILKNYDSLSPVVRQDALQTLASRTGWAKQIVDSLEENKISRRDVTAYTARQIFSLNDDKLTSRLKAVWGELRESPADKQQLISTFKQQITIDSIMRADRTAGRAIFQKTCANCHQIFDAGGKIGPDITGSQRTNLDYLLNTLIDPSAAVNKDYQMQILATSSGRTITGLILEESAAAVTIQTLNEKIIVPNDEIEERKISPLSIMPDGLLQNLSVDQVRQLLGYLMGPAQVPLPDS